MSVRPSRSGRYTLALIALALATILAWVCLGPNPSDILPRRVGGLVNQVFYSPLRYRIFEMILTPGFLGVIALTLVLERLIPARPRPKWLSISALQDATWFFYEGVLHAAIVATYVTGITWLYSRYFEPMPLPGLAASSNGARFVFGILLVDLCMWAQHRVNHAVPWLWQLHTVHHSQRELNFFTDFRYHVLEYVARETLLAIPFVVLGVRVPDIVYFSVFRRWYTRFYHANIKTDLGPLRYVLVTPQSHRIHHSIEPRHQNRNFASLFSIWDFAFGTQYTGWDEYPETGIDDHAFPHETKGDLRSLLVTPIRQMLYPLGRIAREVAVLRQGDD